MVCGYIFPDKYIAGCQCHAGGGSDFESSDPFCPLCSDLCIWCITVHFFSVTYEYAVEQYSAAWSGSPADDVAGIWGQRSCRLPAGTSDRVSGHFCDGRSTKQRGSVFWKQRGTDFVIRDTDGGDVCHLPDPQKSNRRNLSGGIVVTGAESDSKSVL